MITITFKTYKDATVKLYSIQSDDLVNEKFFILHEDLQEILQEAYGVLNKLCFTPKKDREPQYFHLQKLVNGMVIHDKTIDVCVILT